MTEKVIANLEDVTSIEADVSELQDDVDALEAATTAAAILAALLTVDGSGSGLDADLLDGESGAFYLDRANHTGTQTAATVSDFTEAAQDAVGAMLDDSGDIDFTYTDGTPALSAVVKNDSVTYAKIQNVSATDRILGRDTSGAGDIEELTLSAVLDMIGSAAQGDILYRGASGWARLGAGTNGQFLTTGGAAANPSWTTSTAADNDAIHDNVSGEISAITDKTTLVSGDHFIIEDSAASNAKKDVTYGQLISSFSAIGQLPFPASQSASADANTLDDYEENTFTPGLTFGGGSTGMTFGLQSGVYTKIGNTVRFTANVTLTAKGSSTGALLMTGLPFTAAATLDVPVALRANNLAVGIGETMLCGQVVASSTTIELRRFGTGGTSPAMDNTDVTGTLILNFAGTYKV